MSQCTQHIYITYFLEDSDFSAFLFLPVMGSIFRSISAMPSFAFWRRCFSFESWRWQINVVSTVQDKVFIFESDSKSNSKNRSMWPSNTQQSSVTRKMLSCSPLSKDSCSWVRWVTRPAMREATSFSMASRTFGDLKTIWATNGKGNWGREFWYLVHEFVS